MKYSNKFLDFSMNFTHIQNKRVINRFKKNFNNLLKTYPELDNKSLISKISKHYSISKENLYVGLGATEIIHKTISIFPSKSIRILCPTFWEYEYFAKKIGKKVNKFYLKEDSNFELSLNEFEKTIKDNEIVLLCNPNNPTSKLVKKNGLKKMIKKYSKTFFIIDETYLLFRDDYSKQSLVKEVSKFKNLFILFSFSKIFGIGGLRIGVGVGRKKIISEFKKSYILFQTPIINQKIIYELLEDRKHLKKLKNFLTLEKKRILKKLSQINGLKIINPDANFILIKSKRGINLEKKLKKQGIIVRGGKEFENLGKEWARVSIQDKKSNNYLIKELKKISS
mgnify:CR=1 FL=1